MFLDKIIALFKSKGKSKEQAPKKKTAMSRQKVASTRIGELGEHKINIQLDQLPRETKYLSDLLIRNSKSRTGYSQIDHVVITTYGLFVIETKNYKGEIKGERTEQYWSVSNRFKMYNPLKQNYGHIKALASLLSDYPALKYISMISFTMRCRFGIDPELRKIQSDELVVYDVELSEFIGRKLLRMKAEVNAPVQTEADVNRIYETVKAANIVDPGIRAEHVEKVKGKKA
jgi:hypothetical protein